jgi:hypothetical protein
MIVYATCLLPVLATNNNFLESPDLRFGISVHQSPDELCPLIKLCLSKIGHFVHSNGQAIVLRLRSIRPNKHSWPRKGPNATNTFEKAKSKQQTNFVSMETVCENESPVANMKLDTPISAAPADSASGDGGGEDTVGAMIPPMRGVRRLKSSTPVPGGRLVQSSTGSQGGGSTAPPTRTGVERASSMRVAPRPLATPTKLTDAAASVRGSAVARANSSRVLLRATSNNMGGVGRVGRGGPSGGGPPSRTNSAQGLRPFNRDQIVNTSIGGRNQAGTVSQLQRGPGGTLQRHESEMSMDGSLFTMDSVQLRKGQLVADPFDDGTYDEQGSFADHESFVTRDDDNLYGHNHNNVNAPPAAEPAAISFSDLEHLRMTQRLQITSNNGSDDHSEVSFGTMASGLTTDFTDQDYSEYACEETEQAE